jgi:hypothetical protein
LRLQQVVLGLKESEDLAIERQPGPFQSASDKADMKVLLDRIINSDIELAHYARAAKIAVRATRIDQSHWVGRPAPSAPDQHKDPLSASFVNCTINRRKRSANHDGRCLEHTAPNGPGGNPPPRGQPDDTAKRPRSGSRRPNLQAVLC